MFEGYVFKRKYQHPTGLQLSQFDDRLFMFTL